MVVRSQRICLSLFLLGLLPLMQAAPSLDTSVRVSAQSTERSSTYRPVIPTDVLVFDRQGNPVKSLAKDQFVLLVSGEPQTIAFFEEVTAGSAEEKGQWARVQGLPVPPAAKGNLEGGRTLYFFLDDLHLSAGGLKRAREALSHYIDTAMGAHDRLGIVAATRQIGFMHDVSNDKTALHATLEHLTVREETIQDNLQPPMTEAQALAIEQNDPDVLASFVKSALEKSRGPRSQVERDVRLRASALARKSVSVTAAVLESLRDLLRSCEAYPGRKLVFLLSDGFALSGGPSDATPELLQMAEAAQRAGIAVYTLDTSAPGLEPAGATRDEILSGSSVLAAAAGGRFLRSGGALDDLITRSVAETSHYYLLGWRVEAAMLQSGNAKSIRVVVKDHPDFTVRLRETSIDLSRYVQQPVTSARVAGLDELLKLIRSPRPVVDLPVSLYPAYIYEPGKGHSLQILMQIVPGTSEVAAPAAAGSSIEVVGTVLDEKGYAYDFFRGLFPRPQKPSGTPEAKLPDLIRSRIVAISPGRYQVRLAARDPESGRMGSAFEWIDVPPFSPGKLGLSSLFVTEQPTAKTAGGSPLPASNSPSVERRFSPGSLLVFSVHVYNSIRPTDGSLPKILAQLRITMGDRTVLQAPAKTLKVEPGSIPGSVACGAGISLEGLTSGAYVLEVVITDASSNDSATQRVPFWIK